MHDKPAVSTAPAVVHGPPTSFISKHVFSLDHKVIGKQYYALALVAVLTGMGLSWLMRIHLGWNDLAIPGLQAFSPNGAPGGVMTPELYLRIMTMHATFMVFFVLTTAPFAAFGNFFLPIQVGAEDMPFPHFNMMSFWTTFVAFCVLVSAFFTSEGPPLSGWTAYAPLSAIGKDAGPGQGTGQVIWAAAIGIFCIGQLLGALNFISTVLDMRCKGMTLKRLPVTAWAWFITSCMGLTAFAVLMPATILLILDHVAGTSFFISSGLVINDQLVPHSGGSTLLWQHLFWFFGHPEVYIAIVPGMGIITHVLITNMRRPMVSMKAILYSMWALAFLSYMVYGHHMFVSGMNPFSSLVFPFCARFYFHVRHWRS
jgi:cytochrome c oxidase subunit 1